MRSRLAFVALLGLVSVSSVASGAGTAGGSGPRVTLFGDSVAGSLAYVPAARDLLGTGVDLRLEATPCRRLASPGCPYQGVRPASVLDVVQSSSPAELGDIVLVDVGYNESAVNYDTDMTSVVRALVPRGVSHVVWVTMRGQTDNYRQIDAIVRAEAGRWPQIEIADWDAASSGQDWFQADGLHLNAAGAMGLAALLRVFVTADCGQPCQPASAPPPQAPRNLRPPSLVGPPLVGRTLTCRLGSWNGTTPMFFLRGWLRDGRAIAGATSRSRRLVRADRSKRIACRVWATNAEGDGRATTKAVLVWSSP